MAQVKLNTVGATKSLRVWQNFGRECFQCVKPVSFSEMQIDHIIPREYFVANGLPIDNSLSNLACLCKACNSAKGTKMPSDFYTAEQIARLKSITAQDIPQTTIFAIGDELAQSMPSSKFARLYRDGRFHQYA